MAEAKSEKQDDTPQEIDLRAVEQRVMLANPRRTRAR